MIDVKNNLRQPSRLEAHVAWVRQNIGNGPALDWHLAEVSKIRGAIAAAAPTKCQLVCHSE